jgi:hypothetical protein
MLGNGPPGRSCRASPCVHPFSISVARCSNEAWKMHHRVIISNNLPFCHTCIVHQAPPRIPSTKPRTASVACMVWKEGPMLAPLLSQAANITPSRLVTTDSCLVGRRTNTITPASCSNVLHHSQALHRLTPCRHTRTPLQLDLFYLGDKWRK